MGLNSDAVSRLREMIGRYRPGDDEPLMAGVLRLGAKWRSQQIANTIRARDGDKVQQGLFAGMDYTVRAAEGAESARLVGSYEAELHPHIEAFVRDGLDEVVDIGCAEGYYAVGMARLVPQAAIHAYDIDSRARELCAQLAAANGVVDRVRIESEFKGEDFARYEGRRVLFIVDIEGAELELLDPTAWPALKTLPLIVETHPRAAPGVTESLIQRFAPTHQVMIAFQGAKTTPLPAWLRNLGHLDSLLAVWEWRAGPTPWLILRPKLAGASSDHGDA